MTRYLALDAFRGVTIALMVLVNTPGSWSHVYAPLLHANWHGCTLTDLVFPFFLFIIGSAMFLSFKKSSSSFEQFRIALKRAFILFLIGLMLNVIPFNTPIEELRIMGVLQRIGLAYIISASVVLLLNRGGVLIFSAIVLLAYWLVLLSVGENSFSIEGNVVRQFDLAILGEAHMYNMRGVSFEPEGILSTFPAVVNVLLGFELTRYLTSIKDKKIGAFRLIIIGGATIGLGAIWGLILPINKSLWTSSYVIYTTGFSCFILAIFIWLIDLKEQTKIFFPLLVYGKNPLFVFIASSLIVKVYLNLPVGESSFYGWLYEQFTLFATPTLASFMFAFSHAALLWIVSLKLISAQNIS